MNARAQGFLLFSFAFSFALSSAEIVIPVRRNIDSHISDSTVLTNYSKGSPTTTVIESEIDKKPSEDYQGNHFVPDKESTIISNSNYVIDKENINKRNRISFTGMRGKKENAFDNYQPCNGIYKESVTSSSSSSSSTVDKRSLKNYKELFGGKRAPLAFHGMRGKKSEDYETGWTKPNPIGLRFIPSNQKLLIASGLFEDGDDILTFEYPEYSDKKENSDSGEEMSVKRSPYSFQGMRGKKAIDVNLKRTMGFLGMRGKKVPEIWYSDKYKREPQMSFFGMKGKKAQSGFFGMRGKKQSLDNNYYGFDDARQLLDEEYQQRVNYMNQMNDNDDDVNDVEIPKNRFRRETLWKNGGDDVKTKKLSLFNVNEKKN